MFVQEISLCKRVAVAHPSSPIMAIPSIAFLSISLSLLPLPMAIEVSLSNVSI